MDVKDRSRVDVLPVLAPLSAISDSAATTASAPPGSTSFADSLQRVQPRDAAPESARTSRRETPDSRPGSVASSTSANSPVEVSQRADTTPASELSQARTTDASSVPIEKATGDPPVPADSTTASEADFIATEDSVAALLAGLLTGTGVVPVVPPTEASPATATVSPPLSLVKVLESARDSITLPPTADSATSAALPKIPAGLQTAFATPALTLESSAPPISPTLLSASATAGPSVTAVEPTTLAGNSLVSATAAPPVAAAALGTPGAAPISLQTETTAAAGTATAAIALRPTPSATDPTSLSTSAETSPATSSLVATTVPQTAPAIPTAKVTRGASPESKSVDREKLTVAEPTGDVISVLSAGLTPVAPEPAEIASPVPRLSPTSTDERRGQEDIAAVSLSTTSVRDANSVFDLPGAAPPAGPAATFPTVVEQLHPVLHQAAAEDRQLTMTLRPPELGAVRIDVTRHDGQMSARLQTDTASAHQLLTEHLPQLREVLSQLGVSADQVQIVRSEVSPETGGQNGSRMDAQTDSRNSDGRRDSTSQRSPEPQLAEEPERETAAPAGIQTRTALNLRI